ncbi:MAG: ArsR/SmtB family transcription factor [Alphaproteobacteria bacterium]
MGNILEIAEIGALVGDPARACILNALLDGRAHTAKELAYRARITAQTASGHLKLLVNANLLSVVSQGRHRYFRIASPLVVQLLETLGAVAAIQTPPRQRRPSRVDQAMRECRYCYDHLAGWVAVQIASSFQRRQLIEFNDEGGLITGAGMEFFAARGLENALGKRGRRILFRPCLDWTERRYHIAGQFGADLAANMSGRGWFERCAQSRVVIFSEVGRAGLRDVFEVTCDDRPAAAQATVE